VRGRPRPRWCRRRTRGASAGDPGCAARSLVRARGASERAWVCGADLVLDGVDAVLAAPAQVTQDAPHGARRVAAARREPAASEGAVRAQLLAPRHVGPLRARPAEDRVADDPPRLHLRRAVPAREAVEGGAAGLEEGLLDGELEADGAQPPDVAVEWDLEALVQVILEGDSADALVAFARDRLLVLREQDAARQLAEKVLQVHGSVSAWIATLVTFGAQLFIPNEGALRSTLTASKVHTF
jgi:hypothetical protein